MPARSGIGFVEGFGDAGEVLDDAAKDAYRRRLAELDELICEAERFNDIGRAAQLGVERDLLVDQLAQAVGLGGRDRRAVSVSERARVNVTRAIRSAIRRIGEADPRRRSLPRLHRRHRRLLRVRSATLQLAAVHGAVDGLFNRAEQAVPPILRLF